MLYKICKVCGKELEATTENFHVAKGNKYGIKNVCKICFNKTNNEYAKKRYNENTEEVQAINKKYYESHKDSIKAQQKKYAKANPLIIASIQRRAGQKNRINLNIYHKAYRKEYVKTDKGRMILNISQYKSQAKSLYGNAKDDFTINDWYNLLKYFDNSCAYCGTKETKLIQEHIIPLAKGGGYTKDNIVCSCHRCNSNKRQYAMEPWYKQYIYYTNERFDKIKQYISSVKEG